VTKRNAVAAPRHVVDRAKRVCDRIARIIDMGCAEGESVFDALLDEFMSGVPPMWMYEDGKVTPVPNPSDRHVRFEVLRLRAQQIDITVRGMLAANQQRMYAGHAMAFCDEAFNEQADALGFVINDMDALVRPDSRVDVTEMGGPKRMMPTVPDDCAAYVTALPHGEQPDCCGFRHDDCKTCARRVVDVPDGT